MGSKGLGLLNEKGSRLVEFCQENHLCIMNILFDQHPRRKYTWIAPDGRIKNMIDYIIIQRRWKSSIQKCRTYPGADCDTDHQLLMAKVKLRTKNLRKEKPPVRYDLSNKPNGFNLDIQNKFSPLMEVSEELAPEELWDAIKDILTSTAEEHIPKRRRRQNNVGLQRKL